jgi:hypothetical protein
MANTLFDPGREGFLDGTINWASGDIRVMLIFSSYTFLPTHKFLADLGVVDNGRSTSLGSKTQTAGVADAADTGLVATAAVPCKALVIYQHTGNDSTARLIAFIDTAAGLPFTPGIGQTVNITWDSGVNRIFKL